MAEQFTADIQGERFNEEFAAHVRTKQMLAGCVARLGGRVVLEHADFLHAIDMDGDTLTTTPMPFPLVQHALGRPVSKPHEHDEPCGDYPPSDQFPTMPMSH